MRSHGAATDRYCVMRRKFSTLAIVVSLVACAATIALWIRSYGVCDNVQRFEGDRAVGCSTTRGDLCLAWEWANSPGAFASFPSGFSYRTEPAIDANAIPPWQGFRVDALGFHFGTKRGYLGSWRLVILPLWFVSSVFLIWPMWRACDWWKGIRRRLRAADGKCVSCGYDLRGSPDRCPECGTVARPLESAA
jgi:hypothetical protein